MDKYDGRYAFWEKYEKSELKDKRLLLSPAVIKIAKDVKIPAKDYNIWKQKVNLLLDHIIKMADIIINYKDVKIKELEKLE